MIYPNYKKFFASSNGFNFLSLCQTHQLVVPLWKERPFNSLLTEWGTPLPEKVCRKFLPLNATRRPYQDSKSRSEFWSKSKFSGREMKEEVSVTSSRLISRNDFILLLLLLNHNNNERESCGCMKNIK
jgi:hypothetical protein